VGPGLPRDGEDGSVGVIFLLWFFYKTFFINRSLKKLILYLDLGNDVRRDDALGSLKGARLFDTLCVHVDVSTSRWTVGRQ
jgi:hypothetical protein